VEAWGATAMGSMTIGAKYKTTLKDPGTTGVLRMNEDKFTFTPHDPRSAMKLNVDFRSIKGNFIWSIYSWVQREYYDRPSGLVNNKLTNS
jgi:hypothetical protein